jgi:Fe2+ transport protein
MVTTSGRRAVLRGAVPLALAAVLEGCGKASTTASAAGPASTATPVSGGSSGMAGMDMGATPAASSSAAASEEAAAAGVVKPVPTQVLGTAVWQGMKITAQAMTPVPFDIYNGTSMQLVNPPKNVSFHLMVLLNDAQTNVVIPYSSVWGTIKQGSKTPFDESLWPMISRYMGPHYGNDVVLPGSGTYQLSLLISPPVSARHVEYQDVWLKPHTVTFTFRWNPAS